MAARVLSWKRVRYVLVACLLLSLLFRDWHGSLVTLYGRLFFVGLFGLLVFGLFERWPARLPRWLARWALQVVGVTLAVPLAVTIGYFATPFRDGVPFWADEDQLVGFAWMIVLGLLVAPWMAVSAVFRQITNASRILELERGELERQAQGARLRLLEAQIEPHFVFNTLANVRELVDAGSPQASHLLGSLIAYLRAAVPRLQQPNPTLAQELELVRAYLDVMQMRMPDRLRFALHVDDDALGLEIPAMTLLTLVENAVRHGIDPSEDGGEIAIRVSLRDGRCHAEVADTGVGIRESRVGTGLANLRERLLLTYRDDAQLTLRPIAPHGVCAELEFPARRGAA